MSPGPALPDSIAPVSPLTLSHHLLLLAEQAHGAGMARSAGSLLRLAQKIGNECTPTGR